MDVSVPRQWRSKYAKVLMLSTGLLLLLLGQRSCVAQAQLLHNASSTAGGPEERSDDVRPTASSSNWTAHHNDTNTNDTLPVNMTSQSTDKNASTDELLDKIMVGFEKLLSKTYWEQRMENPYFLGEILIPFTAGILVSWLLVLFVCTVKLCCCSVGGAKRRPKKGRKVQTIKGDNRKLKDGAQWMLLERNSSEEEI